MLIIWEHMSEDFFHSHGWLDGLGWCYCHQLSRNVNETHLRENPITWSEKGIKEAEVDCLKSEESLLLPA